MQTRCPCCAGSADTTVQLWQPRFLAEEAGAADDLRADYGVDSVAQLTASSSTTRPVRLLVGQGKGGPGDMDGLEKGGGVKA